MKKFEQNIRDDEAEEPEFPSKTSLKKHMHDLQELAVHLTTLNAEQLATVPLTPELEQAIEETKKIKKNEALRRHYQFLGRLMRSADHEAITAAVTELQDRQVRLARMFHLMEHWRDSLISGDQETLERFIETFPHADRQQLNQLVRSAKGAAGSQQAVTHARKLFRFVRGVMAEKQED